MTTNLGIAFARNTIRTPFTGATECIAEDPNTLPPQDWNRVLKFGRVECTVTSIGYVKLFASEPRRHKSLFL